MSAARAHRAPPSRGAPPAWLAERKAAIDAHMAGKHDGHRVFNPTEMLDRGQACLDAHDTALYQWCKPPVVVHDAEHALELQLHINALIDRFPADLAEVIPFRRDRRRAP